MIIYISGKIGEEVISETTRKKFMKARDTLLKMGHKVYDPTDEKFQEGLKMHVNIEEEKWKEVSDLTFDRYAWILLYDLHFVALSDAVLMLEDWNDSPGAKSEHEFAKSTGKKVFYTDYKKVEEMLWSEWMDIDGNDEMNWQKGIKAAKKYVHEHIGEHYIHVV